jgi:hypothetical protein
MSEHTPKSCQRSGCPGPGEITIASKSQRDSAPHETVSFWITIGSSPETLARMWNTL